MRFPTMFSPIQIGSVTVPNRFVVPPMANNFSDPDGCLSQRSLAYYAARARGGFGLITIESAVVYEQAKGGPRKACLPTTPSTASAGWRRPATAMGLRYPSSSSTRGRRAVLPSPATP